MRPMAYYSTKLDAVVQGFSPCLWAEVAASYVVQATVQIVMVSPLVLHDTCTALRYLYPTKGKNTALVGSKSYDVQLGIDSSCKHSH